MPVERKKLNDLRDDQCNYDHTYCSISNHDYDA